MSDTNQFLNKKVVKPGRALVAGWFSFDNGHATGGDIMAMKVACQWLEEAGLPDYDIAYVPPFDGGVNWRELNPSDYSHVIFVCGPFEQKLYEAQFLTHFASCRLIGLNLSVPAHLGDWNPFDLFYERNSIKAVRPDMVFLSELDRVPVIGICLVEAYESMYAEAHEAIARLMDKRHAALVYIDTRLDVNSTHLRTPEEIESLIARVDVLVTTRLHGAVMAIKNGVPVLPIDPEAGGFKIVDQMKKIGWPIVFAADKLDDQELSEALDYCFTKEAKVKVIECQQNARNILDQTKKDFIKQVTESEGLEKNFRQRQQTNVEAEWSKKLLQQQSLPVKVKRKKAKAIAKKLAYLILPGVAWYAVKKWRS